MKRITHLTGLLVFLLLGAMGLCSCTTTGHLSQASRDDYAPAEVVTDSKEFVNIEGNLIYPDSQHQAATSNEEVAAASYRYAKIMQHKFAGYLTQGQANKLTAIGQDPRESLLTRVQAFATLKFNGSSYPEEKAQDLAAKLMEKFTGKIEADQIFDYLSAAQAAQDIKADVELAQLTPFKTEDPQQQLLALRALYRPYLFANEKEISGMFPGLKQQIRQWTLTDQEDISTEKYLLASYALVSTQNPSRQDLALLAQQDQKLLRCGQSKSFIADQVAGRKVCSLALTEIFYNRGGS
ncbi:MAG: hypothetical protein Q4C74_08940 [Rothia sp. (in: high G+C Gram-positive bacteria)]|nr:hypothetical protein [Rothia sp. (in: high G+C Gram-positive bacteria)]